MSGDLCLGVPNVFWLRRFVTAQVKVGLRITSFSDVLLGRIILLSPRMVIIMSIFAK